MPYLFHHLLYCSYIIGVQAAGLVHPLYDLVYVVANTLKLGGILFDGAVINVDNISVQCHLAQVGALVLRSEQSHLLTYQCFFFLCGEKFLLYLPCSIRHICSLLFDFYIYGLNGFYHIDQLERMKKSVFLFSFVQGGSVKRECDQSQAVSDGYRHDFRLAGI